MEKISKNNDNNARLPILYSLRNCPYAMRARIAIFKSQRAVQLRDLVLSDKPEEMLTVSPKGTVPVVVLADNTVLEESLDIMLWALNRSDPNDLLLSHSTTNKNILDEILALIQQFDDEFKTCLEQYKCAKRYREDNVEQCRQVCEVYISDLEQRLTQHRYLLSDHESLTDIALMPFIRQFSRVERQWYLQSPYPKVKQWLNSYLQSPMFTKVMAKYPLWNDHHDIVLFGGSKHQGK